MDNILIFKKKLFVSLISIIICILFLPLVLGAEYHINFIQEYIGLMIFYGIYTLPFLVFLGVPINILSGFVLKRFNRLKIFINFLLHTIPALIIGLFMFSNGPFALICIPILISSIFFVIDTLVFQKEQKSRKKYTVIILPFTILLILLIPSFINEWEFVAIQKEEKPVVELNVSGEVVNIKPSTCWDSDNSSGCPADDEPFLLPIDPFVKNEFYVANEAIVKVNIPNTKRKYTITVFYIDEKATKKITVKGNKFILPAHIPEQAVKVIATMDSSQKVSFNFGIRNGNR
ncbi:hypothetical protein [Cytobacillus firmus]|uniref:hypothetical protein n=1 Tax=Cytobacillus firmus TaxID=1399 RepID=UPI001C8F05BC|nr:hypothetical protein [Cytobacillus firmus]MBX9975095.1 hypothetical protein [Cytobacillus firmus]